MLKLNDFTTLPGYRENVMTFFPSPLKRQFDKVLSKKNQFQILLFFKQEEFYQGSSYFAHCKHILMPLI